MVNYDHWIPLLLYYPCLCMIWFLKRATLINLKYSPTIHILIVNHTVQGGHHVNHTIKTGHHVNYMNQINHYSKFLCKENNWYPVCTICGFFNYNVFLLYVCSVIQCYIFIYIEKYNIRLQTLEPSPTCPVLHTHDLTPSGS